VTLFAGEEVSLVPTDADVNRTSGLRYKKSKDQARSEGVDSGPRLFQKRKGRTAERVY